MAMIGKTLTFYERDKFIKLWPNWTGEIPQGGDTVILHFGDDNEEAVEYYVAERVIDGTKPNVIRINCYKPKDCDDDEEN